MSLAATRLCEYHFSDCILKIWPGASGKAIYFIILKLTSIPQLYYTLVCFLANPSNPKLNDISWREMGKWLKISQQLLHSTCNTPLHSISQGFPGSLNRQVKGEHGGLRVWPFAMRSQQGEAAWLWFIVLPFPTYPSILNLRLLLRYVFFQELTSSPLPKHEVPISPPLPSESHCAARLLMPSCHFVQNPL